MLKVLNTIDIHLMSIMMLSLLVAAIFLRGETGTKRQRLYLSMVIVAIIAIFTEMLSYTATPAQYDLAYWGDALSYIFTPAIVYVWLLYVYTSVNLKQENFMKFAIILSLPIAINTVLVALNPITNAYFTMAENLDFTRGPFYYLLVIISAFYIIISIIVSYKYRFSGADFHTRNLISFAILPIIGAAFQSVFYGVFMLWVSITLGILMVYLNIQNHIQDIDHLTKAFNRRFFEQFLVNKIESRSGERFTGFMLDLDEFKLINDTFGHMVGDEALKETVIILKGIFGKRSCVGRYGGDEFVVVTDNVVNIRETIIRINEELKEFNKQGRLYKLNFSIDGAQYNRVDELSSDEFLKLLDLKMYAAKQGKNFKRRATDPR